jgi:hypothetical protein
VDPRRFFDAYAADRRRATFPGFDRTDLGHLVRYTPQASDDEGLVVFAVLADEEADRRIVEQLDHFGSLGRAFEWKVYAFDRPADLRVRLAAHGFVADEEETLMAWPTGQSTRRSAPLQPGYTLRRVVDANAIDAIIALQEVVWGRDCGWLRARLVERLTADPASLSVYGVYRDERPVACGWTDFPAGSRYPEMHGGAVLDVERGRGFYAALLDVRTAEAAERGYDALCVDASALSRPALAGRGFMPICNTVPMRRDVDRG